LCGWVALRAATEKTLNHLLISRKHYFNLFLFIFTTPQKDPEQDAAWNPCPPGSFSEVNVDGGQ
jgi:hypothetical protein